MPSSRKGHHVWLYTRSDCWFCMESRRWLMERGIPFTEELLPTNPFSLDMRARPMLFGTPLLVVGDRAVFGFKPDAFAAALLEAQAR